MTDANATPSRRRLVLALLALTVVTLGVALAADLYGATAATRGDVSQPLRQPLAWSPGRAWALVVLGAAAALLVTLWLRPTRPRLGPVLGLATLMGSMAVGAWQAAPILLTEDIPTPSCGPAAPDSAGFFRLEAVSLIDGAARDRLTVAQLAPVSRTSRPLLAELLAGLDSVAIEELGVDGLGQASRPARHCRALVSGSQVTAALPLLTTEAGLSGRPLVPADLPVWRGDFDWWVAHDGELVGARFAIGGHPADAWPSDGLRGQLLVELWPAEMIEQ